MHSLLTSLNFVSKAKLKSQPTPESTTTTKASFFQTTKQSDSFGTRLLSFLKRHLQILHAWVALNIITGLPGLFAEQTFLYYFSMMNLSWAIINEVVVIWIDQHIKKRTFIEKGEEEQQKIGRHVENMLYANIWLDAAYVLAGISLSLFSVPSHPNLFLAFSWSVILQGSALLILDNFFFFKHLQNRKSSF